MAGTRQPIEVLQAKGRKHLTKAEIENRKKTQINANDDNIKPPSFLKAKQKKYFNELAKELQAVGVMSNLDCEALARLIEAMDEYKTISRQLRKTPMMIKNRIATLETTEDGAPIVKEIDELVVNPTYDKLQIMRGRVFKECRQGAADFGMTITSRCKLVVPQAKEAPKENKFAKFAKVD